MIWDGSRRRLLCARDFIGAKSLYYHFDGQTFRCASEIHALFEDSSVSQKPNEGMIGEFISGLLTTPDETLYDGVLRVLPAHCIIVDSNGISQHRYWDLDPKKEIRYRTDEEYSDHFYDVFSEAVRCRMRTVGRVGADLSGGLDSSSVVCMAQELIRQGAVSDNGFVTFSKISPGNVFDESEYIQEVISKWNLTSFFHTPEPADFEAYTERVRRYRDFPGYPIDKNADEIKQLMKDRQCRVVLTGEGGDEWLAGSYGYYLDLLVRLKIYRVITSVYKNRGWRGMQDLFLEFIRAGVLPVFPVSLQRFLRIVVNRSRVPLWVDSEFAKRVNLEERLNQKTHQPMGASFAQNELYSYLVMVWNIHSFELVDRNSAYDQLECRHPLNDRRVFEFGLGLPEDQRRRNGQSKFILRQAMRGLLPEKVRLRLNKTDYSQNFVKQFSLLGGEKNFRSLASIEAGWVDQQTVLEMYRKMKQFSKEGFNGPVTYIWQLWMIWAVSLWWQLTFESPNGGLVNGPTESAITERR
jgi:asparagine synthase (glutamine-hydrolysing)